MENKILLVEDTTELAALITLYLNKEGMEIRLAESAEEALSILETFQPELVLLDLNLPGMGGFEFLRIFRKTSFAPVLIISARDSEEDIIEGLGEGADEYITKPFSPKVLVARVRAMFRRTSDTDSTPQEQPIAFGSYTIHFDRYLLERDGQRIPLSSKEFAILAYLVKNAGKPLTVQTIYHDVWGRVYGDLSAVAVYIQRLRRKIEAEPSKPKYIENIHGLGYQFNCFPLNDEEKRSPTEGEADADGRNG